MQPQTINDLRDMVHQAAVEKGWWPEKNGLIQREPAVLHMLMVTEIAEATEEARAGNPPLYYVTNDGRVTDGDLGGIFPLTVAGKLQKPEGELIELADTVIRILDYCGAKGWDIQSAIQIKHDYNQTRAHRHGGKKF
jgi:hypothetical protein